MTANRGVMCRRVAYCGGVLAAMAVGGSLAGCGSAPVAAPTAYVSYSAGDGTFAFEYPDGWEAKGGGKNGPLWATITSGPAEIRVNADLAGSLMGDIAASAMPNELEEAALEFEPVHRVHEQGKEKAEADYSGYTELGSPQELKARLGPGRKSEFTASTTFGTGLHGYRATVLAHSKRVVVYCVCPESNWPTLQPAFDHVLGTLVRGEGGL